MPVNPKSLENLAKGKRFGIDKAGGNRGGRSILEKVIRDALEANDFENLKATVGSLIEVVKEGGKGAASAASVLYDRGYGKVIQPVDVPEGGLTIQVVTGVPPKQNGGTPNS